MIKTQGWPLMNADERRLKTQHLALEIRVHLRLSAANKPFSAICHAWRFGGRHA
jgi:hypothetical protein